MRLLLAVLLLAGCGGIGGNTPPGTCVRPDWAEKWDRDSKDVMVKEIGRERYRTCSENGYDGTISFYRGAQFYKPVPCSKKLIKNCRVTP
jgi:hypothetical protein